MKSCYASGAVWLIAAAIFSVGGLTGCGGGGAGSSQPKAPNEYTIGGTATGLEPGETVSLLDNGGDSLLVGNNGAFSFTSALTSGAAYAVTVATQPSGEVCTVSNGTGTIGNSNVGNVGVSCVSNAAYAIGGTVSGLSQGATAVLLDNGGNSLAVTQNGSFSFPSTVASGVSYTVTVGTQPSGEVCIVSNGSNTVSTANVTNVTVTCDPTTVTVNTITDGTSANPSVLITSSSGDSASYFAPGAQGDTALEATLTQISGGSTTTFIDSNGLPYKVVDNATGNFMLFHSRADQTGMEYLLFSSNGAFLSGYALVNVSGSWYTAPVLGIPPGTSVTISEEGVVSGFDAAVYGTLTALNSNTAALFAPSSSDTPDAVVHANAAARKKDATDTGGVPIVIPRGQMLSGGALVVIGVLIGGPADPVGLIMMGAGATMVYKGLSGIVNGGLDTFSRELSGEVISQEDAGTSSIQSLVTAAKDVINNGESALQSYANAAYDNTTSNISSFPAAQPYIDYPPDNPVTIQQSSATSTVPADQTYTRTFSGNWNWAGTTSNGCQASDGGAFSMTVTIAGQYFSGSVTAANIQSYSYASSTGQCSLIGTDASDSGSITGTLQGNSDVLSMSIDGSQAELDFSGTGSFSGNTFNATITRSTGGSGAISATAVQ